MDKRYEEALERARKFYNDCVKGDNPIQAQRYVDIFPELKESEDERIREAIEGTIRVYGKTQGEWLLGYDIDTLVVHLREAFGALEKQKEQKSVPQVLPCSAAWFEEGEEFKQKEQKPAEWIDNFEENIRELLHDKLTWHSEDGSMSSAVSIDDKTLKDIISGIWFYVGKEALKYPNKELSQPEWSEEDELMRDAVLNTLERIGDYGTIGMQKDWIKSLRHRPHWKPSEDTLNFVKKVADGEMLSCMEQMAMGTLHEQLKKL